MKMSGLVLGVAYIGSFSEWSWISTVTMIIVGIFLFWILHKLVFTRINWGKKENKTGEEIKRVIINESYQKDEKGITLILSKEEDRESDEVIGMPFTGELIRLEKVPDPIFSEKMVGDGFAIRPYKGEILSPVNGAIQHINDSKTSISFNTIDGRDVMLYIGLNATRFSHQAITLITKEGDRVKVGQKMGVVDLGKLEMDMSSSISPVVFSNLIESERIVVKQEGIVEAGMQGIVVIEQDSKE